MLLEMSVDKCARVMEPRKEKQAQCVLATSTQSTPKISSVTMLPPVLIKPVAPMIVIPEFDPDSAKETTPITSNVSFTSSHPDPDWIMKVVTASRHEAIIENQVVEARFVSMVVTGRPVIELLDDGDDVGLDVALGEAPGVTPGIGHGMALGVIRDTEPDAAPTLGTALDPVPATVLQPESNAMEGANLYNTPQSIYNVSSSIKLSSRTWLSLELS
jgi:hypothetical protein